MIIRFWLCWLEYHFAIESLWWIDCNDNFFWQSKEQHFKTKLHFALIEAWLLKATNSISPCLCAMLLYTLPKNVEILNTRSYFMRHSIKVAHTEQVVKSRTQTQQSWKRLPAWASIEGEKACYMMVSYTILSQCQVRMFYSPSYNTYIRFHIFTFRFRM